MKVSRRGTSTPPNWENFRDQTKLDVQVLEIRRRAREFKARSVESGQKGRQLWKSKRETWAK